MIKSLAYFTNSKCLLYCGPSVVDPLAKLRAEKHEIYAAVFGGHLFNDLFLQGRGMVRLLPSPPGSATDHGSPSKIYLRSKGLFTPSESKRESDKDQRTRDQKNKRETSKKIFAFAFAFAWCGQALRLKSSTTECVYSPSLLLM